MKDEQMKQRQVRDQFEKARSHVKDRLEAAALEAAHDFEKMTGLLPHRMVVTVERATMQVFPKCISWGTTVEIDLKL